MRTSKQLRKNYENEAMRLNLFFNFDSFSVPKWVLILKDLGITDSFLQFFKKIC